MFNFLAASCGSASHRIDWKAYIKMYFFYLYICLRMLLICHGICESFFGVINTVNKGPSIILFKLSNILINLNQ